MLKILKEYFQAGKEEILRVKYVILATSLYLIIFEIFFHDRSNCIIQNILGFPCPTCGMTRAYKSLFSLDFKDAFYYHPLFWIIPFAATILLLREHRHFKKLDNRFLWLSLAIIFIAVYIIRMIILFPEKEPLDYQWESILGYILSKIQEIIN